jgi:hypothetical protein
MRTFKEIAITEALRINSIKWKTELEYNNYKVKFEAYDTSKHDLLQRIAERTNTPLKVLRDKIYKAAEKLILKKASKDWFKHPRTNIGIYFKESEFTGSFLIDVNSKYLRLNTILDKDMVYKYGLKWEINESYKEIFHGFDEVFEISL